MYDIGVDNEINISDIVQSKEKFIDATVTSGDNAVLIYDGKVRGMRGGIKACVTVHFESSQEYLEINVLSDNLTEDKITGNIFNKVNFASVVGACGRDEFLMTVDISTIYEVLRCGGKFYNTDGVQESIYLQLKNAGYDSIRLRHWNNPNFEDGTCYQGGHNDLCTNIKIARIAKLLGFKFVLDFHYSDFWADPGKQSIPKEWAKLKTVSDIEKVIYNYTYDMLVEYDKAGCVPEYVQVGNEITFGMIKHNAFFTDSKKDREKKKIFGAKCGDFNHKSFIKYINAGVTAVKKFDTSIQTIIHIDRGADNKTSTKFYDRIRSVDFDIIGLSYYSFYHGDINAFRDNITKLAERYNKRIYVAETSYAFTTIVHEKAVSVFENPNCKNKNWEISPQGQADKMCSIANELLALPNDLGIGISYWEPAWLAIDGAGWAKVDTKASWCDQALFSYDGVKLPSLDVAKHIKKHLSK